MQQLLGTMFVLGGFYGFFLLVRDLIHFIRGAAR